ncbi:endonuclease/exonuclease/phosphatase [Candidatus Vecturithrix granuli]|uniref:Endonuclease/exonuclease/phosphatase n=1 Tax=Vecturithrix granuli TaxID=1499967 RepID=A0A081BVB2_VECG1|nr:endonuclease/exonuclease/phosphatase [Candidatus Vecturithrix granuli]
MKLIQLSYVKNIISRHKGRPQQELAFCILVKNIAYEKLVEVHWAGEDHVWHVLPAEYHSSAGEDYEIWHAYALFHLSSHYSLPGNIEFALHYHVRGRDYWDNNSSHNYFIDADSGIRLQEGFPLLNIDYQPNLEQGQQFYPITVAVQHSRHFSQVYVHWTTDDWKTVHVTPCFFKRRHWDKVLWSNARNPNQYGCETWISQLQIGHAYRVQYAIGGATPRRQIWDNNLGRNYIARRERLKVLTLNLHCYQEEHQDHKFAQIAKAIRDLNIDIVCLQEVGEPWNDGKGDWNANAAKIIHDYLGPPYHVYTDWSHLGFDRYREGVAILSKYKFLYKDAGYISSSQDVYNIHARKVVMVQVSVPYIGEINVFSTHLSWWQDGFREQFERLRDWAQHKHDNHVRATLLCGDFNAKAGSEGYKLLSYDYEDQFLKANERRKFDKIFCQTPQPQMQYLHHDGRIDYIFLKKGSRLTATSAKELFTQQDYYGRVSDHTGYYLEFEPT